MCDEVLDRCVEGDQYREAMCVRRVSGQCQTGVWEGSVRQVLRGR